MGKPETLRSALQDLCDARDTLARKIERKGLLNSVVTVTDDYNVFTGQVTLRGVCCIAKGFKLMVVCSHYPDSASVWLIEYECVAELVALDKEDGA